MTSRFRIPERYGILYYMLQKQNCITNTIVKNDHDVTITVKIKKIREDSILAL